MPGNASVAVHRWMGGGWVRLAMPRASYMDRSPAPPAVPTPPGSERLNRRSLLAGASRFGGDACARERAPDAQEAGWRTGLPLRAPRRTHRRSALGSRHCVVLGHLPTQRGPPLVHCVPGPPVPLFVFPTTGQHPAPSTPPPTCRNPKALMVESTAVRLKGRAVVSTAAALPPAARDPRFFLRSDLRGRGGRDWLRPVSKPRAAATVSGRACEKRGGWVGGKGTEERRDSQVVPTAAPMGSPARPPPVPRRRSKRRGGGGGGAGLRPCELGLRPDVTYRHPFGAVCRHLGSGQCLDDAT